MSLPHYSFLCSTALGSRKQLSPRWSTVRPVLSFYCPINSSHVSTSQDIPAAIASTLHRRMAYFTEYAWLDELGFHTADPPWMRPSVKRAFTGTGIPSSIFTQNQYKTTTREQIRPGKRHCRFGVPDTFWGGLYERPESANAHATPKYYSLHYLHRPCIYAEPLAFRSSGYASSGEDNTYSYHSYSPQRPNPAHTGPNASATLKGDRHEARYTSSSSDMEGHHNRQGSPAVSCYTSGSPASDHTEQTRRKQGTFPNQQQSNANAYESTVPADQQTNFISKLARPHSTPCFLSVKVASGDDSWHRQQPDHSTFEAASDSPTCQSNTTSALDTQQSELFPSRDSHEGHSSPTLFNMQGRHPVDAFMDLLGHVEGKCRAIVSIRERRLSSPSQHQREPLATEATSSRPQPDRLPPPYSWNGQGHTVPEQYPASGGA